MYTTYSAIDSLMTPATPPVRKSTLRTSTAYSRSGRSGVEIASVTGPLESLHGQKVLLLADVENLIYSARNLGYKVSFRMLGQRLQAIARSCSLHAFFSRPQGDDTLERYFQERGWITHPKNIEEFMTHKGWQRHANSDNDILFHAGNLVTRHDADFILVASGDGLLAGDLARLITGLPKSRHVATVSLAGSTSFRLDARTNPNITFNIEIGLDCLIPA